MVGISYAAAFFGVGEHCGSQIPGWGRLVPRCSPGRGLSQLGPQLGTLTSLGPATPEVASVLVLTLSQAAGTMSTHVGWAGVLTQGLRSRNGPYLFPVSSHLYRKIQPQPSEAAFHVFAFSFFFFKCGPF